LLHADRLNQVALEEGTLGTPFDYLGMHPLPGGGVVTRVFIPWARSVALFAPPIDAPMNPIGDQGLFQIVTPVVTDPFPYRLRVEDAEGRLWTMEDPYRFPPLLDEGRVRAFLCGEEIRAHEFLGSHPAQLEGVAGTLFAVWAPHARAVSVAGDMNGWDGRCHPMRPRGATGVWELFIPAVGAGARYKYRIVGAHGELLEKADPFGREVEFRPATASVVAPGSSHLWRDTEWMDRRATGSPDKAPISVYEIHLGSWRRRAPEYPGDPGWLSYEALAEELIPYVVEMGFTHIELLPLVEHPLDESWGYQPLGFFAPTSRFGSADGLRALVDRAHAAGIGVILDWVPGHFPEDAHGLVRFDGTELFEHPDPRQARHPDWGTLTFHFGRPEVRAFLLSSAVHWMESFHLDGLRVDAVASMLYLDYSRRAGEWVPNPAGGRENREAEAFLRELNDTIHREFPGTLMVAEESTAWPRVSHGTDRGGLGFDQKWNMGWMNDTLEIMSTPPDQRSSRFDRLTFALLYAFSERFILPLSHDEVVHGKGSLLTKMPGVPEEQFANLRSLLALQWAHPGKKLLFMGGELGQWREWAVGGELDWALLEWPQHDGIRRLVQDLNRLYRTEPALHQLDYLEEGFEWLDCGDKAGVTLAYLRWTPQWEDFVVVVANLSGGDRGDYRLPVPHAGEYEVLLNSSAPAYGASTESLLVPPRLSTTPHGRLGREQSIHLPLPALTVLYLRRMVARS